MISEIAVSMMAPYLMTLDILSGEIERTKIQQIQPSTQQEIILHNWYAYNSNVQSYVNYAYNVWWMDFVKLIECENGTWDPKKVSSTHDHWLCQLNYSYNKKFINSTDFSDPYKQLDYCYEKFKVNPKLRYWPNRKIKGKKCSDYVEDRFEIILI